ncbi:uncharacterized protein DDB_G0283357 [Drosophila hydei]|uniref:Uncharacterized protein DDB_G0283357 n=1 Tax=Drosophila hydei TaxID=7224 RepID=A0A6J1LHL4_DROHY|nr:uncharacterized protein DDB_G0283357 [Drosophila hydei]
MNRNKQQSQQNANRIRSLGLLDKTMPLTAATPPQLRNRRQFQFNGMNFETNPLSLQRSRGGLDGDAGDGRFPAAEEWRDPSPYHTTYKTPMPTINRPYPQHSCQSDMSMNNEVNSPRMVNHSQVVHQPDGRTAWQADNYNGNSQAGGEDTYSNSYNCNYSINNANNSARNNTNSSNNNSSNNASLSSNKISPSSINADRFQQVLAKYSKQPVSDDYSVNSNINNNNATTTTTTTNGSYGSSINSIGNMNMKRNYNNRSTGNSISNSDRKNNIPDELNNDQSTREQPVFSPRMYNRSNLKLSGFRYGQMRAGGGCSSAAINRSKMDYITLAGFLLGYLTSNMLFFLCWYFTWLKGQVVKLRNHFLGQANLWEFFDFEDTTRYSMQTKLLLAPIILGCSILYCVVNVLHLLIKLVRADVPRTVVDFVQRIVRNHWP